MKLPRLRTVLLAPLVLFAAFYFLALIITVSNQNPVPVLESAKAGYQDIAIFGASGTAGDGILKASLADPDIKRILVVTRRTTPRIEQGVETGKVQMIMHQDYLDYTSISEKLDSLDAVFWAIGTSSFGVDEKTYGMIHVDFPVNFVSEWIRAGTRPGSSFHYISSSDISEDASMMWAREKVRAEKTLFQLAEDTDLHVIAYRPDYIGPTKEEAGLGQKLLYWFFKPVNAAVRATQIGQAMIEVSARGSDFKNGDKLTTGKIVRYSDAYEKRLASAVNSGQSSKETRSLAGSTGIDLPNDVVSQENPVNPLMKYLPYSPTASDLVISREDYLSKLYGFWLGQCIANWTGLVTEMDKIGGEGPHGEFYTRESWGQPDQPSIWSEGKPSDLSANIDWVLEDEGGVWGADDDTDIEYMYQHLLLLNQTSMLTGEQIRDGWLKHIYSDENTPFVNNEGVKENFLWVSNQRAHDLMRVDGLVPPATSDPLNNVEYEMIDAQLTTEIFGLFAPARPDVALSMAYLPIRTTARENAAWASEFYVVMYSLASAADQSLPRGEQIMWMADTARQHLPDDSYSAKMFDFVKSRFHAGVPWEQARDEVYQRYQLEQLDGYDITSRNIYCNGCFASGINFASSLVSLFYGQGNFKETVKIAVLVGWDSDNPAATWGGLLGFMHGKDGIEQAFGRAFADRFNIHRTRGNFPNGGLDTFQVMAEKGLFVIDRVVQEEMGGGIDLVQDRWLIPLIE